MKPSDILRQPFYDVKQHLAHVAQLHAQYALNTEEKTLAHTEHVASQVTQHKQPDAILGDIVRCVRELFEYDRIYRYNAPTLEDREYLTMVQHQLSKERIESASNIIVVVLRDLLEILPDFQEESTMTVPLYTLTPDFPNVVQIIFRMFAEAQYGIHDTFPALKNQFTRNMYRLSGIDIEKPSTRKLVTPLESKEPIDYLAETPFWDFFRTPVPFMIGKRPLSEHGFIIAKPGFGKTQLLSSFAARFLQDPEQPGLFCLDPAGDWFEVLRDRVPPDRLVVLDPETDPTGPPLNFLDFNNSTEAESLQSFFYLMSTLSGGLSDKQTALMPYLLKLIRKIPNASLDTLRLVVEEKLKSWTASQFASAIGELPPVDQAFFQNQFYNASMNSTKEAISWKIYGAMASDAFRKMFSAPTNSFDARAAMRDRKVVLARGSENTLGEHGLPIFMQYVVSQLFLAALGRFRIPAHERHQCYLLCDEASHIFNQQTTRILVECRKLGLSFIAATQLIEQIPKEVKAAIYGATSVKFAGEVSHTDADTMGKEMRCSEAFIQSMKTRPPKETDWAVYVSGMTDRAVKVTVPMLILEGMPRTQTVPSQSAPRPSEFLSPTPSKPTEPPRDPSLPRPSAEWDSDHGETI